MTIGAEGVGGRSVDAPSLKNGPRRLWVLLAWLGLLAAGCGWLWQTDADPGLKNTVIHFAVALAVVGYAVWVLACSGLPRATRRFAAFVPVALTAAYYLQLLPIETINNGDVGIVGWRWRWADPDRALAPPASAPAVRLTWQETPHDYPAFLGGRPWAEVEGIDLATDWKANPPRELWRQRIGAGWSGFAIVGEYAVTQEQRGEQELVACYELRTGKIAWTHADDVRWDPRGSGALGGIGPRATPSISEGRVVAQGATGIVNCLDASTGKLLWRHDTLAENNAPQLMWGKAGSPLVLDGRVVVSVGGPENASLVAYDLESGDKVWSAGSRRSSYATPVATTLGGVPQILSLNEEVVTAHRADDGKVLWEFDWPSQSDSSAAASQPVPIGGDRVLLTKGYGLGAELIEITGQADSLTAASIWKNRAALKNKMSNALVRDGFAYGLDDVYLQCVDLQTGKPRWKKRRSPSFGHGQVMLAGDVILVLSEEGELILAEVNPKKYHELASLPVLEGVTWNNPALSGSVLLVRNSEEAAAYELPLRKAAAASEN